MAKEWIANFEGHEIRVVNTWFSGAKLYIDGDCRDENKQLIATSRDRPLLSANLPDASGRPRKLEVFLYSVTITHAKICLDGTIIGGEVF